MKKNILVYIIFSFLLFVGGFLCGEYITNMFHRLDEPLKKFDLNIKYTQENELPRCKHTRYRSRANLNIEVKYQL